MIPYTPHEEVSLWFIGGIPPWGIFHFYVAWGFGIFYAIREFLRRKDVDINIFLQMLIVGFMGAMFLARIFAYFGPWTIPYGAEGFSLSDRFWAALSPHNAGWVAWGGIIGGLGACYLYAKLRKADVKKYFNITIPGVPLGMALARLGCFIAGDHLGKVTDMDLPWLISMKGNAMHPAPLYNSLFDMTIFIILLWLYDKNLKEGIERNLGIYFIAIYSAFRFVLEFARGDYPAFNYFFGLTTSQLIAIAGFAFAMLYFILKKPEKKVKIKAEPLNIPSKTYSIMIFGMLFAIVSVLFIGSSYWLPSLLLMILGLLILLYGINSIFPKQKISLKNMLRNIF